MYDNMAVKWRVISIGKYFNVSTIRAENFSIVSLIIFCATACSFNCLLTMLNMISIGFKSADLGGIEKILHTLSSQEYWATLLFWDGSPSCKISLFLGLTLWANVSENVFLAILANNVPLIFSKCCSCKTAFFVYEVPTKKWAVLPPILSFLPFAVIESPSLRFGQSWDSDDFYLPSACICVWNLRHPNRNLHILSKSLFLIFSIISMRNFSYFAIFCSYKSFFD